MYIIFYFSADILNTNLVKVVITMKKKKRFYQLSVMEIWKDVLSHFVSMYYAFYNI